MAFSLSQRASGVLLHPTSLPGPHGCGDLGAQAHAFARFLAGAEQRFWQMLPVGPLGYGNSPYSALSAFAGNPLLISIDKLVEDGLLPLSALESRPRFHEGHADYAAARAWRGQCLRTAFQSFGKRTSDRGVFEVFCAENQVWLDDFALYAAIKHSRREQPWIEWDPELRARDAEALQRATHALREEIEEQRFQQWLFDTHWRSLRGDCALLGVGLVGDLPIFVAHDSADVWAHRELFHLDAQGHQTVVAGVPPDYFSETGQRWGNPLYRWDVLERTGYRWWLQRFARLFSLFDAVRLDHFIGFTRYWEIPADEPTAQQGHWVPGPGAKLFKALGPAELIAEDLGAVTPEVTALRDQFHFPGIKLLQFAFGTDPQASSFLPYNYDRNSVAYTGTHDNDTTQGWFHDRKLTAKERKAALAYLGTDGREIHWEMMRAVWSSVANLAMAPVQDLLGLGTEARMNLPGTARGNWEWRLREGQLDLAVETRLRDLTRTYGRSAIS
jgi:4-alpha-glucanotransferase